MVVLMLCYFIRIMDPTSSLGRICLGENVYVSSSEKVEGHGDWNAPEYTDTAGSKEKKVTKSLTFYKIETDKLDGEELSSFACKMGKSSRNKKRAMENLNLFYPDIETSSSTGRHLTQEKAAKEALALRISQKFALLEEVRPVLETMAYHNKYKKVLDKIWKDKVLEGKINKNALVDTRSDINTMPYRIYEQLGREEIKMVDRGITTINHTQVEAMGILTNVLFQVGVTTIIAKFLILDIPIDRDAPIVVGRGFIYTIGGIVNTPERLFSTFDGICHQTFRAARSDVLRTAESDSDDEENMRLRETSLEHQFMTMGGNDAEAESSRSKRSRQYETIEEDILNGMGCEGEIDDMLRINLREAESNKEILTFVAWIRDFNIKEPIYSELCHEFYSTYEFDEVCADDELQTKKIIKFKLGGRAHSLTLLEFSCRLELYHADELEEDVFDVYFQGGLRSDDHFNAQEYWLSISREENLSLSSSHASTIRNPILRTPKWVRECGLVDCKVDEEKRSWYSKGESDLLDLDMTTLRELIDSEGRLILEDPQPGVLRVGITRPLRASMQDLYAEVFKHMAGVYSVDLQGAYNPPRYAHPQYDQYYQQYPPQPPQYHQQQQDDDE
ncbi:putative reverse transcriptase, RNA-dependent DNA polymerase [Tanacetum coccineum]